MKKTEIFIIALAVLVFFLFAWFYSYLYTPHLYTPPASVVPPANLKIGEAATKTVFYDASKYYGGFEMEVSVLSVKKVSIDKLNSYSFDSGKIFLIFDVEIKNVGAKRVLVASSDFSMSDSEGYHYDCDFSTKISELLSFQDLYPNEKMKGKLVFRVPENATNLRLLFGDGIGNKLASWTVE